VETSVAAFAGIATGRECTTLPWAVSAKAVLQWPQREPVSHPGGDG